MKQRKCRDNHDTIFSIVNGGIFMSVEEPVFPITPQDTPPQGPRPFREIPRLWLRVHEMSEEFFRNEIPRTSTSNTFYSILIYAVISLAFSIFQTLFSKSSNPFSELSPEAGIYSLITGMGLVCLVFIIPIGFYISNGIYYGIASLLGGKGSFSSQAYIDSLFTVPIGVLTLVLALVSLIPVIGWFISLGLGLIVSVFNIVLTVRCYKAVHNFSTGRAVAVVLLPMVLVIIPICLILTLALMGPGIGSIFSQIISLTLTPMP
jgi:hypothetical protein